MIARYFSIEFPTFFNLSYTFSNLRNPHLGFMHRTHLIMHNIKSLLGNLQLYSITTSSHLPIGRIHLFSLHLPHKGKTRNPEKVEYFHPPIRFPLSSLRKALSPFSMITRPALVAASLVTSWSPANAENIGQPFSIKLT